MKIEEIVGRSFKAEDCFFKRIWFSKENEQLSVGYHNEGDPDFNDMSWNFVLYFPASEFRNALEELVEIGKCSLSGERGDIGLWLVDNGFGFKIDYKTKFGGVSVDFTGYLPEIDSEYGTVRCGEIERKIRTQNTTVYDESGYGSGISIPK